METIRSVIDRAIHDSAAEPRPKHNGSGPEPEPTNLRIGTNHEVASLLGHPNESMVEALHALPAAQKANALRDIESQKRRLAEEQQELTRREAEALRVQLAYRNLLERREASATRLDHLKAHLAELRKSHDQAGEFIASVAEDRPFTPQLVRLIGASEVATSEIIFQHLPPQIRLREDALRALDAEIAAFRRDNGIEAP